MRYSDLLSRLAKHGLKEVGRLTVGGDSTVMVARPEDAVFPFSFKYHTLYAPADEKDFWLDPEEIDALLRRFNLRIEEI